MQAKLTFHGATGTVTGSRFLLEIDNKKLLIDCGLFQGPKENRLKNWEPFPVPPRQIDKVLLTHAHIDHSGYLPRFCSEGFTGEIHCTHATADLCDILLKDSGHLQEEDARWANKKGYSKHKPAKPLFTVKDAEKALEMFAPMNYGEDYYLNDNIRIKFKDAGHILGSSFIDIKTLDGQNSKKIVFSGDMGRPTRRYLNDPVQIFNVDYLVLESTYGDRLHDEISPVDELVRVIEESIDRGGVLVVPAFAVGRTQTFLYMIRELEETGRIPAIPIYIDSPMAINVTDVFRNRISDQNLTARLLALQHKPIFQPQKLQICESREQSKAINKQKGPAIIISASGMATGGRILHHLEQRLPEPENTILFIGYQAAGTRGRTILEGSPSVKMHGREVPIRAKIESISGFSGHADYNEILAWLMGLNKAPVKIFIVHGEPEASNAFAEKIRTHYGWDVEVPGPGDGYVIEL